MYMSQSLTIKMQLDAAYISRNNYYVIILHQEAWLLFRAIVCGREDIIYDLFLLIMIFYLSLYDHK